MAKQKQQSSDPLHEDGVYTGPGVPMSVFYKGRKPARCHSFTQFRELRDPDEQAKQAQRLAQRRAKRPAKKRYKPRRH